MKPENRIRRIQFDRGNEGNEGLEEKETRSVTILEGIT